MFIYIKLIADELFTLDLNFVLSRIAYIVYKRRHIVIEMNVSIEQCRTATIFKASLYRVFQQPWQTSDHLGKTLVQLSFFRLKPVILLADKKDKLLP